jgi:hypothetical protein
MKSVSWVVYQLTGDVKLAGMKVVCEQGEWDALQLAQPGKQKLIRKGITNEGEAERLARGTSGDRVTRLPARG